MPFRIAGEPLEVRMDGQRINVGEDGETVVAQMPSGQHHFTVGRDETAKADVVVAEPTDQGRPLSQLFREGGRRVRWARELDFFPIAARTAGAMVMNVSYAAMPPDTVAAIEAAVRGGLTLVGLFHAGCLNVDRAMAELTGVRATFDGTEREYWGTASREATWRLTADGSSLLKGLPG